MAEEITKLEHYHQGRLGDSLIEVFHKIDHMLKDQQYVSELETWKRSQHEKPSGETQSLAPNQNEQVVPRALLLFSWRVTLGPISSKFSLFRLSPACLSQG